MWNNLYLVGSGGERERLLQLVSHIQAQFQVFLSTANQQISKMGNQLQKKYQKKEIFLHTVLLKRFNLRYRFLL